MLLRITGTKQIVLVTKKYPQRNEYRPIVSSFGHSFTQWTLFWQLLCYRYSYSVAPPMGHEICLYWFHSFVQVQTDKEEVL